MNCRITLLLLSLFCFGAVIIGADSSTPTEKDDTDEHEQSTSIDDDPRELMDFIWTEEMEYPGLKMEAMLRHILKMINERKEEEHNDTINTA